MTKQIAKRIPKKTANSRVRYIMQSVRMTAGENKRMKALAKRKGLSFNRWALEILTDALEPTAERMRRASRS